MTDVTQASKILWERGVRILQGNRLAGTDEEHIEALSKYMGLNGERDVADMGCGFGHVSKLLSKKLPEAKFWLINANGWQLSKCPEEPQFWWFAEDMCATSIAAGRVDMVMFNWSLCHVNAFMALTEAHRITNDKGRLFVYDLERVSGDNVQSKEVLNAVFLSDAEFRAACDATGWRDVESIHPGGDDTLFRQSCCDDELYDRLTNGLGPCDMDSQKVERARQAIRNAPTPAALLCSFGKDSMVLLHLVREVLSPDKLSCHGYPIPVIWHRHPWFPFKNEFGNGIVSTWSIEAYDYPPLVCGVKCNDKHLELVSKYPFGDNGIDIPLNTEPPLSRRDYVCGKEWLMQPKTTGVEWKWRTIFHGHKSSDVDPYEGAVPLKRDTVNVAGVRVEFPIHDWTDSDVWDYIEANHIPYDKRRYVNRGEVGDAWTNPDYIHACTRCIDPRESAEMVDCPKLGEKVPNVGGRVLRLEGLPNYIEPVEV